MLLSGSEREQVVNALLRAFPRYADLKYMVSIQLGENIEAMVPQGSLSNCTFELVSQMEAQGRLKELLRGALRQNPKNPHLVQCGIDLGIITVPDVHDLSSSEDIKGAPIYNLKSSEIPPLPRSLRTEFVDVLLRLPGIQSFEVRSSLLRGLPSVHTLYRNSNATKQDLMGIIDQLCLLGQTSSQEWPLMLLLDSAIENIRGYTLEEDMQQLRQKILKHYKGA